MGSNKLYPPSPEDVKIKAGLQPPSGKDLDLTGADEGLKKIVKNIDKGI